MDGVETRTCEQIGEDRAEIQVIKSLMDKLHKTYEEACEILGYNKEKYKPQFRA